MLLIIAAALMFFTGIAHSYLGERYILTRLFKRRGLPQLFGGTAFTTGTLRFAWHLTTVVWWALAYLTVVAAYGELSRDQFLLVLGAMSFVSAALPLYFTRGQHVSWLVFLLVGALVLMARGAP